MNQTQYKSYELIQLLCCTLYLLRYEISPLFKNFDRRQLVLLNDLLNNDETGINKKTCRHFEDTNRTLE